MNKQSKVRYVGPIMRKGDMADAVIEAIYADNNEKEIIIDDHASYFRVKVEGDCLVRVATVSEMLGSSVNTRDIEALMPSFEGFIRVETDQIRFLSCA